VNTPRRFPPPWTIEDHNDACFIVEDANGLAVAYFYYEEEPGRRAAANLMTKEEARRVAANIVKLLGLLAVRMPALTQPWPPASPFQITTRRAGAD
jgi:endo-1,4-beta-D-glucanase Y